MKLLGYLLIFLAAAFIVDCWLADFMAADVCLDAGQVYDYATSTCRNDIHTSPYTSFVGRHIWQLSVAGLIFFIGLVVMWSIKNNPKTIEH